MSELLFDTMLNNKYNVDSSQMTLWMGDLDPWMDETFIKQVWLLLGEHVVVKLIRDKRTGISSGYAFIGFTSIESAQRALTTVHGSKIPNSQKLFRLNWASGGGICDRKEDRTPEYSLFVGDLSNDIDETFLLSVFRSRYPSCHSAKIMTDPLSGISRGYGFVRFLNQMEQQNAMIEMNGILCNNRPMRVSFATPKINHNNNNQQQSPITSNSNSNSNSNVTRYLQLSLQAPALIHQPTDPNNTTVFVGGLSSPVTEEELGHYFSPFGQVSYVKIPQGKGCGFVQYVTRSSAEQAIERMNGFVIGNSRIRLSWGRSQADKTPTTNNYDSNNVLMSPTMTNTSMNSNSLLGSFKPLSPPHQYYQQQQSLFQSEDDWLNTDIIHTTTTTTTTATTTNNNNNNKKSVNDWHINGIYA